MVSEFIVDYKRFRQFCTETAAGMSSVNGTCSECPCRKICRADRKLWNIDAIQHMSRAETRFPWAFDLLKRNPALLYAIPSSVYQKLYGTYHQNLPCPFMNREILEHLDQIGEVCDMLRDDRSKQTYLNVLMYRLTFNRDYALRAYSVDPQYFIPSFRDLGKDEVYVDCGAYIGDTMQDYCRYNQPPKTAYLFEADALNVQAIKADLNERDLSRVHIIQAGVYRYTGDLYFVKKNGTEGYLSETEEKDSQRIPVTTIDDAVKDRVTFIKMDIEGSEKNALVGASGHIRESLPRLAVCVYHSVSDLWEIPLMIRREFPGYTRFELRHHTGFFSETVFYASQE